MTINSFIDTNIWVYAHFQDENQKSAIALELLETLPSLTSSTQVLNEYYSVMLKKKIADNLIQDNIEIIISICEIKIIAISTIRLAHQLKLKYGFSYWNTRQKTAVFQKAGSRIESANLGNWRSLFRYRDRN